MLEAAAKGWAHQGQCGGGLNFKTASQRQNKPSQGQAQPQENQ